jgi:hypothetical protein
MRLYVNFSNEEEGRGGVADGGGDFVGNCKYLFYSFLLNMSL